jgi:ABC-type uncharacterized transport system substrate-binding protein
MNRFMGNLIKTLLPLIVVSSVLLLIDRGSMKQRPVRELALVMYNDSPLSELSRKGIEEGLTGLGWEKERDYRLGLHNAQGDISTLNLIIDGLISAKPALVFVVSTPSLQAVVRKIREIPVVFTTVADPVLAGAGKNFDDHLPNVTGISTLGDYRGMAEMIRSVLPGVRRVATLFSPGEANSVNNLSEFRKYTGMAGIELLAIPVNSTTEVADATLSMVSAKPDLVCQIIDNLTASSFSNIVRVCDEKKIPVFGFVSEQADKGAVLVLSRDYVQAGRDAVRMAEKIFNGEPPADIPFEFVSRTDIILNRSAANRYQIRMPDTLAIGKKIKVIN